MRFGESSAPAEQMWQKRQKVTGCFLTGVRLSTTLLAHHNGDTYFPTSCTAQFSTVKNRKEDFLFDIVVASLL